MRTQQPAHNFLKKVIKMTESYSTKTYINVHLKRMPIIINQMTENAHVTIRLTYHLKATIKYGWPSKRGNTKQLQQKIVYQAHTKTQACCLMYVRAKDSTFDDSKGNYSSWKF
jgi:hypothetical protein